MKKSFCFLLLSLVFIFSSCDRTGNDKDGAATDNLFKFKNYIAYNTYGNTSIAAPIRVELAKPVVVR